MIETLQRLRGLTPARLRRSLWARSLRMFGRLTPVREAAGFSFRAHRHVSSPYFPHVDTERVVGDLRRDGLARGLDLPMPVVAEIRAWAEANPCYANRNKAWGFHLTDRAKAEKQVQRGFTVGTYFNATRGCAAVRSLQQDPVLREIAYGYVGPRAQLVSTGMWWSFASNAPQSDRHQHAQMFHFDLDDFRFFKFFFYLTDVDAEAGPHVFVQKTHRSKKLGHLYPMRRLTDDDVESSYGRSNIVSIQGPAGSGFAEDTFGLHKGLPPVKRDRLILEFEFAFTQGFYDDAADERELAMLPNA